MKLAALETLSQVQVASQTLATAAVTDPAAVVGAVQQNAQATAQISAVHGQRALVEEALKALTGRLAPARVAFALATVLVTAALFALGVITASAGSPEDGPTTPTTTTAPTTFPPATTTR